MSLTANLSAIRGNQPGTVFRQFKDECTVMINYVQNLLQKGTDVMSSLRQEHDTQATSLMINYAGIEKLRSLLDKIQRINNFALDLGSDDETENSISNAVSSTLVESSRATINPTFNDDSRAAINSAFDESSRAVVNPSFEEFSLVSCNVQVGDILDMIYLSGNNPYRFWLRYYSTTKLDEVMQILTTRSQNGDLRPCHKPYRGQHVCVYDGQQCYRAKIINIFDKESEVEISVLNIDNGKQFKVKERTIYHLDSDVLNIPVQGLCCRLQGSLGDSNLWNDVVASLFSQVLTNSNLVVTVTAKLPENPPQFVVDIDCHNEERRINKLELSKWVTATVFPKLCEVKQKSLPINRETLNTLFTYLDPVTAVEQATSNEEEFASNACALNSNLQQLSISKDKRKSHSNDTRSAMALELASTSKVENSRCVLDWNLPQNGALPTPITPNVEKSLVSQRQMTVYTAQKKQPTSPDKCKTYVQIANCRNIEVISTYKRSSSSSGSKTLPVSPSATMNHQITSNSKLRDSSSFVVGNGLSKKLEPEKCDYDLLQPVLVYTAGQIYDAMLAYVENPAEFYVHIVCEENVKIDDLHAGMNDFYNSLKACFKSKSEAKKYIGKYCAAYYALDHQWCRALIIDWNEARDDLDVIVKFVDYGNVSPVPLALVQPLRKRFTALPICAQRCHLANIHPVESTKENILTTWSNQSANLFKCLIDVNAVYSIILTESSNGSSASLPVLLKFNHNDNDSMINKSMVELGYAVHFSPIDIPLYFNPNEKAVVKSNDVQTETKVSKNAVIEDENSVRVDDVQIETKVSKNVVKEDENSVRVDLLQNDSDRRILEVWDPMAEDYYSEVNTMYHDDENASYVVTGYKPKDEKRVCKLYATKGYCYKGPTCLKEHTLLNPDGWTTDREAVFVTAYNELLLPAAGSDILLNVTLIVKSNVFWAFVVDDLTGMTKRAQTEAANAEVLEETLATLTLYMNQDSNVKKLQPLTVAPAVGQLVVARFMDGLYYRARVVDFDLDKYEVRVLFVDYGNVEWLKMSDVRDIEPRYLHLPFQAVECMIANVEALPGDKLGRGSLILNELLRHMEHVHARVVLSSNDECRMEVLIFDDEGNDLGNKLIQAGVCTQRRLKVPVSQKSITVLPG